jgi:hypothetical protein
MTTQQAIFGCAEYGTIDQHEASIVRSLPDMPPPLLQHNRVKRIIQHRNLLKNWLPSPATCWLSPAY